MNIPKSDLKYEYMRGQGPGGQHKNKTDSKVRITHLPTGLQASCDERSQHQSKKKALRELERRIVAQGDGVAAEQRKADRDRKIRESPRVRTYNSHSGRVTDHRTGIERNFRDTVKGATIQDFLDGYLADL